MHLRPGQVAHRHGCGPSRPPCAGFRRSGHAGSSPAPRPSRPPRGLAGWVPPADALTPGRWPGLPELRAGKIGLLGQVRELGDASGWEHADAPRLWRFHLHYWDWAWGLAADPDRLAARATFARLWRSWQAWDRFGRGDAWHPYPAALRAWSWCGLHRELVAGSDIEPAFTAGLAAHAGFLRRHLEYDVGGNHLIKELKAVVGLAVFFADERLLHRAVRRLTGQLATAGAHRRRSLRARARLPLPGAGRPHRRGGPARGGRAAAGGGANRGHRPDAALAGRGADPGRAGAAAQRRLPGRPGAARRAAARPGARRPAARAARDRPGPGRGRRLAPARRRRAAVPAVPAGPRARRHVRLPAARGRGTAAGRHRHVQLRARPGARLRAVHRRAQHGRAGRGGLHRGVGSVPGRAAGPGQRAGRPGRLVRRQLRGGPRRVPAPARPPPAPPPLAAD